MTGNRVTVSDPVDLVGHKAAEETVADHPETAADHPETAVDPIGATEAADHPETAVEAGPAAEETAATEQEAEMTDGSLPNPSHKTLTTTTTEPKGRKSHRQDCPKALQAKGPTEIQATVIAMTR